MTPEDFTADCQLAMSEGMAAENTRRQVASQMPGSGVLMPLGQPPSGPGVGVSDVPGLEVVGEGYGQAGETVAGFGHPQYAADPVGGPGYGGDIIHQPVLRHVSDLGADGLLIEPGTDGGQPFTVAPSPVKPSLWSRLTGRLRRR